MNMLNYALHAAANGLCVLPPKEDGTKAPFEPWKKYQSTMPDNDKLQQWFVKRKLSGMGFVTGAVSGNLEVMDFDIADAWPRFVEALAGGDAELMQIMENGLVETTPKGVHLYYRCSEIEKNKKLAMENDKVMIETRGEGGYIVAAPSSGKVNPAGHYEIISGSLDTIPTITPEQRLFMHRVAHEVFDQGSFKVQPIPTPLPRVKNSSVRPGDDFNDKHTVQGVISKFGWQCIGRRGEVEHWRKPGSNKRGHHATVNHDGTGKLYVFSTEAMPFEAETSYTAFSCLALLEHGGDYEKAASELAARGYGTKTDRPVEDVPWMKENKKKKPSVNAAELMKMNLPPIRWIVEGLIPEGCIVLAGSPKIGKSWLATDMMLTISTPDRKLFGQFKSPEGTALYLALEDSLSRLQSRIRTICEGLMSYMPQAARPTEKAHICTDWPIVGAGCMEMMQQFVESNPDTRLIIVDTLQKVRPTSSGRGANAYEVDYAIVSQFQQFALEHHLAVILITHLRKSNGMGDDDPFEQVTGSMGISGAADATIRIKRGKQSDVAEFYIRGRDVEEQMFHIQNTNGTWYYIENDKEPAHIPEIREFVKATGKDEFKPAEFNRWHRENYGTEIKNIWIVMKRLYENGNLRKMKEGSYSL